MFNAGERVEGYSDLLWTLWVALGLQALGAASHAALDVLTPSVTFSVPESLH